MDTDPTLLVGRYELGEQIGVGGSARVYRAIDRRLGREVAVKVLDEALAESVDPAARQRFEIESRTASTFTHPNAVTVFDAGSDQGTLFMVMELVTGGSLAQRLAEGGPLPSAGVARLGFQVASALAAAHRVGIIHRDVKPSNILLDDQGNAKLADFGIARRFDEIEASLTSTGMVMGTRQYVSPEQAAGAPLGPATDVFSLGTVLFEAVTGERAVAAVERHDDTGLDPRSVDSTIGAGLAAAIARATAIPVEDRYEDADLFARELASTTPSPMGQLASGDGTETVPMPAELEPTKPSASMPPPPAPLVQQLTRERRRRRLTVALLGAAAIATLVIIGLALGNDDTPAESSTPAISLAAPPPATVPTETNAVDTTAPAPSSSNSTTTPTAPTNPVETPDAIEVIPGFPVTADIEEFIVLLEDRTDVAGDKARDLAKELRALVERSTSGKGDVEERLERDAEKLSDKIDKWVEDDDLDPLIADVARKFIDHLSGD